MCLKKKMLLSQIVLLLPGRLVGWLVGRSVGRSVGWSVGSLVGRVVGASVCWLFAWLVGRFLGRRYGWCRWLASFLGWRLAGWSVPSLVLSLGRSLRSWVIVLRPSFGSARFCFAGSLALVGRRVVVLSCRLARSSDGMPAPVACWRLPRPLAMVLACSLGRLVACCLSVSWRADVVTTCCGFARWLIGSLVRALIALGSLALSLARSPWLVARLFGRPAGPTEGRGEGGWGGGVLVKE